MSNYKIFTSEVTDNNDEELFLTVTNAFVLSSKDSVKRYKNLSGVKVSVPHCKMELDEVDDSLVFLINEVVEDLEKDPPRVPLDEVEKTANKKFQAINQNLRVGIIYVNIATNIPFNNGIVIKNEAIEPDLAICFPQLVTVGTVAVGNGTLAAIINHPDLVIPIRIQ